MEDCQDNYILKVYDLTCSRINLLISYDIKLLNLMLIIFGIGFGFGVSSSNNDYKTYLLIYFPFAIYSLLFYFIHVYLIVLSLCGYKKWLEELINTKSINLPVLLMESLNQEFTFRSLALYGSYIGYTILLVLSIYKSITTALTMVSSSPIMVFVIIFLHIMLVTFLAVSMSKFLSVFEKAYIFSKEKYLQSQGGIKIISKELNTTLHLHFLYGSKPKKKFKEFEKKVFGGINGGHIYLQLDEYVYGFEPADEKKLHIFPKKKFNSIFRKENYISWKKFIVNKKVTSIEIPLDIINKTYLLNLFEDYCTKTPYDYAFFGMRCAASSYQILSDIGLFPPISRLSTILKVPYPRVIRRKLLKTAVKCDFKIIKQQGSTTRIWEKE